MIPLIIPSKTLSGPASARWVYVMFSKLENKNQRTKENLSDNPKSCVEVGYELVATSGKLF